VKKLKPATVKDVHSLLVYLSNTIATRGRKSPQDPCVIQADECKELRERIGKMIDKLYDDAGGAK